MDNLMYSTLEEITAWIRIIELLNINTEEPETRSFYEDNIT